MVIRHVVLSQPFALINAPLLFFLIVHTTIIRDNSHGAPFPKYHLLLYVSCQEHIRLLNAVDI